MVQHIGTFARAAGGDWEFAFTQEWPLGGIRHQLSYIIPVQRSTTTGTGLGDVALNYRYQLVGTRQPGRRWLPDLPFSCRPETMRWSVAAAGVGNHDQPQSRGECGMVAATFTQPVGRSPLARYARSGWERADSG